LSIYLWHSISIFVATSFEWWIPCDDNSWIKMWVECIVAAYLFRATAEVMGQAVMDKPSRVYNSWVNRNEIQRTLTQS
jgi:hypothetical protein